MDVIHRLTQYAVNSGPWIGAYTLNQLTQLPAESQFTLPICSLATPYAEIEACGDLLLPPLYLEAMDAELQSAIFSRIQECFPVCGARDRNTHRIRVVQLPPRPVPQATGCRILAFSVDTAIEEHGPHLPLATDTIQSYGVLTALARSNSDVRLARPLDYGQLTWGLPFGFSIDLTADLLARYVTGYANALVRWMQPQALYVVDVHGSITHRNAIVQGLKNSTAEHWRFRWLHEPLAEFASAKGDQHAGGVETALVEHFAPQMIDCHWWPGRKNDIVAGQMTLETAVSLSADLSAFTQHVRTHECNGIIGDVNNYQQLETETLFDRMLKVAVDDIQQLTAGHSEHNAGANLW